MIIWLCLTLLSFCPLLNYSFSFSSFSFLLFFLRNKNRPSICPSVRPSKTIFERNSRFWEKWALNNDTVSHIWGSRAPLGFSMFNLLTYLCDPNPLTATPTGQGSGAPSVSYSMDELDIVQIVNANPGVLSWSQPHTVCLRKGAHGSLGIKINTFKVS